MRKNKIINLIMIILVCILIINFSIVIYLNFIINNDETKWSHRGKLKMEIMNGTIDPYINEYTIQVMIKNIGKTNVKIITHMDCFTPHVINSSQMEILPRTYGSLSNCDMFTPVYPTPVYPLKAGDNVKGTWIIGLQYDLRKNETYTCKVTYSVSQVFPDVEEPFWTGIIYSNELKIIIE